MTVFTFPTTCSPHQLSHCLSTFGNTLDSETETKIWCGILGLINIEKFTHVEIHLTMCKYNKGELLFTDSYLKAILTETFIVMENHHLSHYTFVITPWPTIPHYMCQSLQVMATICSHARYNPTSHWTPNDVECTVESFPTPLALPGSVVFGFVVWGYVMIGTSFSSLLSLIKPILMT